LVGPAARGAARLLSFALVLASLALAHAVELIASEISFGGGEC
jgi:hypothetical protein